MSDDHSEYPTDTSELDAHTLIDLADAEIGEDIWLPVSMMRGEKFRAMRIQICERISVNQFEEHHALDKWPQSDRLPISHEYTDGDVTGRDTANTEIPDSSDEMRFDAESQAKTISQCQCGHAWVCKQSVGDTEIRECPSCGIEETTRPYETKEVRVIHI